MCNWVRVAKDGTRWNGVVECFHDVLESDVFQSTLLRTTFCAETLWKYDFRAQPFYKRNFDKLYFLIF